jgi:hypothetical protein
MSESPVRFSHPVGIIAFLDGCPLPFRGITKFCRQFINH